MPSPLPTQISGADFLAARKSALLADAPRVGKTGAAIMACDKVAARSVLIITTATNRFNFARDVRAWQTINRTVGVVTGATVIPETDVVVLPWSMAANKAVQLALMTRRWHVLIVDESHYAKNPAALRTHAVFGKRDVGGVAHHAERVWLLSGTPIPNAPNDLWPALHMLERRRLEADEARGWPSALAQSAFTYRYCTVDVRHIGGRRIEVVMGGKNEDELAARLDGWWLRRTQEDVGIQPPRYDTLLLPPHTFSRDLLDADDIEILEAAEKGETAKLTRHMAELRRYTGRIKAAGVVSALGDEFACGLDSVVLMCWHHDTVDALHAALSCTYETVVLTGATSAIDRQRAQTRFQGGSAQVFIGQMQAAGEAIDLSRACNLIFVEPSFVPKDMAQAALRITNHAQKRNCLVRVAALQGSIDERVTAVLVRKVASIQKVLEKRKAA